jgi:acyl-[acyl carrier protein]--UDP-N-acetylglucosamine O-acyltransferase
MIGMGSVVTKNKLIFCGELWYGNPAKYQGMNHIGIARNNITQEQLFELNKQYSKI